MAPRQSEVIAITGIGLITPAGHGLNASRKLWREGANFLKTIQRFPSEGGRVSAGFPMSSFSMERIPDRKAAKILNDKDLSAIVTMMDAVVDSGIDRSQINPDRLSLYCAAGNTQLSDLSPYFSPVKECVDQLAGMFDSRIFGQRLLDLVNPMVVMRTLLNNSLCFGSRFLDARGSNSNYFDFEASGVRAMYEAIHALKEGRTDFSVVTSVSPLLEPFFLNELAEDGVCADSHSISKSRPYDPNSSGIVPGESAVSLTLERLSDAVNRSAKVIAVIDGIAIGSEARFPWQSKGEATTLRQCLTELIHDLPISSREVGLVVGSGSGHSWSDMAEVEAIAAACDAFTQATFLTSVKGITGECFESSFMLSTVAAIDMLDANQIFPMWGRDPDAESFKKLKFPIQVSNLDCSNALISGFSRYGMVGGMHITKPSDLKS
jgi:3-oxoacyl-[acyl-carrier-protein] synthase II